MKITGYILEDHNEMPWAYTCHRLIEEAKKADMDLRLIGIHQTVLEKDGPYNCGEKLENRDFIINRYKWNNVKDYVNQLCKLSYNELSSFNTYVDKALQLQKLDLKSVLMPDYIIGTALSGYSRIADRLGSVFVAKGLKSSMGREIFLIRNDDDLSTLAQEYGEDKEWLFEEYISTSAGRDMRLFSLRGEVIAAMERRSKDDFRANVALGAEVSALEISDVMRECAREIYEKTGLDLLGIDLLYGSDLPWFCEINVMPGIKGMEKATGVNVAGRMIGLIHDDILARR